MVIHFPQCSIAKLMLSRQETEGTKGIQKVLLGKRKEPPSR